MTLFNRAHWREYLLLLAIFVVIVVIGFGALQTYGRAYNGELAWECLHQPGCADSLVQPTQSRPQGPRGGGPPPPVTPPVTPGK